MVHVTKITCPKKKKKKICLHKTHPPLHACSWKVNTICLSCMVSCKSLHSLFYVSPTSHTIKQHPQPSQPGSEHYELHHHRINQPQVISFTTLLGLWMRRKITAYLQSLVALPIIVSTGKDLYPVEYVRYQWAELKMQSRTCPKQVKMRTW